MKCKHTIEIIITILAAILLEVLFFNFSALRNTVDGLEEIVYHKEQLLFSNWDKTGDYPVSLQNPIIYIEDINIQAASFTLKLDINPIPQTINVYYTSEPNEALSTDKMLTIESASGNDTIQLDTKTTGIYVYPGVEAGRVLYDVSFVFNEGNWNISIARIVAMLVIYWGTKFLMSLQKTPDYGAVQED